MEMLSDKNARAFHGDPLLKEQAIAEMIDHQTHDRMVKGSYGFANLLPSSPDFRGCMIGCLGGGQKHRGVLRRFGIPLVLSHLFDRMFERLPEPEHLAFVLDVLRTIPVGSDLSLVSAHFFVWLLADPEYGASRHADPRGKVSIDGVVELYQRRLGGDEPSTDQWRSASASAYAASAYAYAHAHADAASAYADAAAWRNMASKLISLLAEAPILEKS